MDSLFCALRVLYLNSWLVFTLKATWVLSLTRWLWLFSVLIINTRKPRANVWLTARGGSSGHAFLGSNWTQDFVWLPTLVFPLLQGLHLLIWSLASILQPLSEPFGGWGKVRSTGVMNVCYLPQYLAHRTFQIRTCFYHCGFYWSHLLQCTVPHVDRNGKEAYMTNRNAFQILFSWSQASLST